MEGEEIPLEGFDNVVLPDINDEEYEALMPQGDVVNEREFYDNLKRRFGAQWALAAEKLNIMWRKKNKGIVPSYLSKGLIRKAQMGYRGYHDVFKKVKNEFPNARFMKLQFRKQDNKLQVKPWGDGTWMDLYEDDDINSQLPKNVKKFLGSRNPHRTAADEEIIRKIREEYPDAEFNLVKVREQGGVIQLKYSDGRWWDLKKTGLDMNTRLNPNLPKIIRARLGSPNLGIRMENVESAMSSIALAEEAALIEREDVTPLHKEYDKLSEEMKQLTEERDKYEAQLRQMDALAENYKDEAIRLQDIILDSNRSEEERDAAEEEWEIIEENIDELETEMEETENRLGLTRREKIMRMLKKYGIPVAIASLLATIISVLIAVGARTKEAGETLEKKGKEMSPGILGFVLSLIERTAGGILKFVGNNIWILVVAVGIVLLVLRRT